MAGLVSRHRRATHNLFREDSVARLDGYVQDLAQARKEEQLMGATGPERIALLHGEARGGPNAFASVLTFEPDGAKTRIEMRTVVPTKELRDEAVERSRANAGGRQTLGNLAAYVTEIVRKGPEG